MTELHVTTIPAMPVADTVAPKVWGFVAAITRGASARLDFEEWADDAPGLRATKLREVAELFRMASCAALLAAHAPKEFADEKAIARSVLEPLVEAALAGRARACMACGSLWNTKMPGLSTEELGRGRCGACASDYSVEVSARRATTILLGDTAKPLEASKGLVDAEPMRNEQGRACGTCDGTYAHEHRTQRCTLCGAVGLAENMSGPAKRHVCKPAAAPAEKKADAWF